MTPLQFLYASLCQTYDAKSRSLYVSKLPQTYTAQQLLKLFQKRYPSVYKAEIFKQDSGGEGGGGGGEGGLGVGRSEGGLSSSESEVSDWEGGEEEGMGRRWWLGRRRGRGEDRGGEERGIDVRREEGKEGGEQAYCTVHICHNPCTVHCCSMF